MKIINFLRNPYRWLQDRNLLTISVFSLLIGMIISHFCKVEFQVLRINPLNDVSWIKAFFNQLIIIAIPTILFFITAKIINKKTRLLDILTTVCVALIPYYILGLQNINHFLTNETHAIEEAMKSGNITDYLPSPLFIFLSVLSLVFIAYYIYLLVTGFKTATNSKKTWHYILFVLALIFSDIIASIIINTTHF